MQINNNDRLIRETECKNLTGLSRQTRWRMEKEGKFPKRMQLGAKAVAWSLSEILAWKESLLLSRNCN